MRVSKAERVREDVSRCYPFVPCAMCQSGWVISDAARGVASRCPCFRIHQAKVARLVEEALERVSHADQA
jgi:Zn-finger protein